MYLSMFIISHFMASFDKILNKFFDFFGVCVCVVHCCRDSRKNYNDMCVIQLCKVEKTACVLHYILCRLCFSCVYAIACAWILIPECWFYEKCWLKFKFFKRLVSQAKCIHIKEYIFEMLGETLQRPFLCEVLYPWHKPHGFETVSSLNGAIVILSVITLTLVKTLVQTK